MEAVNSVINFFKNISTEQILDLLIAIVIVILFSLLSSLIAYGIIKIFKWKSKKKEIKENSLYKPIKTVVIWIGLHIAILVLRLPSNVLTVWNKIFRIGIIVIIAIGIANMFSPDSKIFRKLSSHRKIKGNQALINFISKVVKVIVYVIAAFLVMTELNYDLGGLIAGLGLSGVIIALAAQDIAKNLFGGVAIILDKPFSIGDWIETANYSGTVEDISFRSTRIRTVNNTVVTIQNSTLSNEPVINYAKLPRRRFSTTLRLALETNSNVVESIIGKLKFALSNTEGVLPDDLNVYLQNISDDGIEIGIFFNTDIVVYYEYLKFAEDVNLLILKVLESENVKLAYPTQKIYLADKNTANKNAVTDKDIVNAKKAKNSSKDLKENLEDVQVKIEKKPKNVKKTNNKVTKKVK
jgi:MscS family membrane protein